MTRDNPTPAHSGDADSAWDSEEILTYADGVIPTEYGFRMPETPGATALMGAILKHAAAAGLVVFDPQRQWLWLPDGKAMPAEARDARKLLLTLAEPPREKQPGWAHWVKLMHLELDPILLADGFKDHTRYPLDKDDLHGHYMRPMEGGVQEIILTVGRIRKYNHSDDERWGASLSVVHLIDEIAQFSIGHWKSKYRGAVVPLMFDFFAGPRELWIDFKICVEDANGRHEIERILKNEILPMLDRTRTLSEVEKFFNSDDAPRFNEDINWQCLLLARWYADPSRYETLRERMKPHPNASAKELEDFARRLADVDAEPPKPQQAS